MEKNILLTSMLAYKNKGLSPFGNVWKTVWRNDKLTIGCKWLKIKLYGNLLLLLLHLH